MFFSRIDKLELPDLDDTETNPPKNHQDNGATSPVNTHTSLPHSPLEDTLVSSSAPLPRPRVEAGNAALQAREGYILDVRLLGDDYTLYGVYQDWVHQNIGDHLDGGIEEGSKWQARWKKLVCITTQCYDAPSGKVRKRFVGILSVELDGSVLGSGTMIGWFFSAYYPPTCPRR